MPPLVIDPARSYSPEQGWGIDAHFADSILWAPDVRIPRSWVHPSWLRRIADWALFRLCYVGGREFIESAKPVTLFSHEREGQPSYNNRRRRAFYRNHVRTIIGLKADAIYQPQVLRGQGRGVLQPDDQPPTEEESESPRVLRSQRLLEGGEDPTFEAFLKDVDCRGTNADPWWDERARWASVFGRMWVGIAMSSPMIPIDTARRLTVAEARALEIRPYYYSIPPTSLINWGCDDRGCLQFAVALSYEESRIPLPRRDEKQPKSRVIARVLYRDREERFEIGPRGEQRPLGVYPHNFGEVPLIPLDIRSDGLSELEDSARMAITVYNYDQLVGEQIYRQTFNQAVAKVENRDDFMNSVTGTDALIVVKPGEDFGYVAPNTQTIETICERAWELVDEIYACAQLKSRPGGKGTQPATDTSGIAYAFEHKQAETNLAGIAARLEEVEQRLGAMRARALGLDPEGFTVLYPREFDVRALLARANEALMAAKVGIGGTAMAEVRKNFVRKILPRLPAGRLHEIDIEIDEMGPDVETDSREKNQPPNQGMQPPGMGAAEDRMMREASDE